MAWLTLLSRTFRERSLHRRSSLRSIRVIESRALFSIILLFSVKHNNLHRLVYLCSFCGSFRAMEGCLVCLV
jgi:hypothetical protein